MPNMLTKGGYTSQGSRRRAAGGHRLPRTHAGDTHVHTHAQQAVPVTSFLGDSAQLESHTSESPPRASSSRREEKSEEEREPLGRQEVHRRVAAGAALGPAEGGGGEGSDFLALGRLLGVGLSDYRGAGTLPARTRIMRCLQKRRNPLEHRESYTIPVWNRAHGLSLLRRRQPEPFSLAMWVADPRGPGGSKDPHQASRLSSLGLETSTSRLESPRPVSSLRAPHPWASVSCPALAPAPTIEKDRQALAEWEETSF